MTKGNITYVIQLLYTVIKLPLFSVKGSTDLTAELNVTSRSRTTTVVE